VVSRRAMIVEPGRARHVDDADFAAAYSRNYTTSA